MSWRFYPLSERVGILVVRETAVMATFLSPDEARAIVKLKAAQKAVRA